MWCPWTHRDWSCRMILEYDLHRFYRIGAGWTWRETYFCLDSSWMSQPLLGSPRADVNVFTVFVLHSKNLTWLPPDLQASKLIYSFFHGTVAVAKVRLFCVQICYLNMGLLQIGTIFLFPHNFERSCRHTVPQQENAKHSPNVWTQQYINFILNKDVPIILNTTEWVVSFNFVREEGYFSDNIAEDLNEGMEDCGLLEFDTTFSGRIMYNVLIASLQKHNTNQCIPCTTFVCSNELDQSNHCPQTNHIEVNHSASPPLLCPKSTRGGSPNPSNFGTYVSIGNTDHNQSVYRGYTMSSSTNPHILNVIQCGNSYNSVISMSGNTPGIRDEEITANQYANGYSQNGHYGHNGHGYWYSNHSATRSNH